MFKKLLIVNILIFFNFTNINIAYSIEPDVFVQSTVNRAADTLGGDLSKEERIKKLKIIAKTTVDIYGIGMYSLCLLYTSPSPRDRQKSRMPSSA